MWQCVRVVATFDLIKSFYTCQPVFLCLRASSSSSSCSSSWRMIYALAPVCLSFSLFHPFSLSLSLVHTWPSLDSFQTCQLASRTRLESAMMRFVVRVPVVCQHLRLLTHDFANIAERKSEIILISCPIAETNFSTFSPLKLTTMYPNKFLLVVGNHFFLHEKHSFVSSNLCKFVQFNLIAVLLMSTCECEFVPICVCVCVCVCNVNVISLYAIQLVVFSLWTFFHSFWLIGRHFTPLIRLISPMKINRLPVKVHSKLVKTDASPNKTIIYDLFIMF